MRLVNNKLLLIPLLLLLGGCLWGTRIEKISMEKPKKYEVLGLPVSGYDCNHGVLKPLDFGRAVHDATIKTIPPADGLVDAEFFLFFQWGSLCVSVMGTPVRIAEEEAITPSIPSKRNDADRQ